MTEKYRLVTRSDFDGLVSAVLLRHLDLIESISFVHPKDMQDGRIEITNRDITTNLPLVHGAHMAFDHHVSETLRNDAIPHNYIMDANAPSTSRLIWQHFGAESTFPERWNDMLDAVDKADTAQYNVEEVMNPQGWEMLNLLTDPRTGLGRFRDFRISNYSLMMDLIGYCEKLTINEILDLPDVAERIYLFQEHAGAFNVQLMRCATVHRNLVTVDLRNEDIIHPGSRFAVYALFPQCNVSVHQLRGLKGQNTVLAAGRSIFDRSSAINLGQLMLEYGGGGHAASGTCQVPNEVADEVLEELIAVITGAETGLEKAS